jgi:hypothetical protein
MTRSVVLLADAAINFILGLLLMFFSQGMIQLLGLPVAMNSFYPSILGAVLTGIGAALLVECFGHIQGLAGLGLGGAIAINLCGGIVLAWWLVFGGLDISIGGRVFLWALVAVLIGISSVELGVHLRKCGS